MRRSNMAQRILVVDDETGVCHLLKEVLAAEDYQVATAGSVEDALRELAEAAFDLAIVDLLLPGLNGLVLAEAIRMLDPCTPVILMTAYGTPTFEMVATHPAISHYVHKPFDIDRLLELVQESIPAGKEVL
jgi:two-component system response regulator AtoC